MSLATATRPTWAEISCDTLRANYRTLRYAAARAGAEAAAVIKANAYGHGAAEAIPLLAAEGCEWFAVTCLDEARLILPQLKPYRTLILSGLFPGEAEEIVRHGLTPVLGTLEQFEWLASAMPHNREAAFPVHIEVDTGMSRQGFLWRDTQAFSALAAMLRQHPQLRVEAVMTHFASPEEDDPSQTTEQIARLREAVSALRELGIKAALLHAGNSVTVFEAAQTSALERIARENASRLLLRPGISLYGYGPRAREHGLLPALTWKTRIAALREIAAGEAVSYNATFRAVRPTRIALLPLGYADGYSRLLSNRGEVLIRGHRARIAGRVTMDQTMVDVTSISSAQPGDEVVLLGTQREEAITADDLATSAGTISYEVLCALGWRVPRRWV